VPFDYLTEDHVNQLFANVARKSLPALHSKSSSMSPVRGGNGGIIGYIECLAYVNNPGNFKLKKYNEKLN
jgi:hypothetical protein